MALQIVRRLSDAPVLDFDLEEYADLMQNTIESFKTNGVLDTLASNGVKTSAWLRHIDRFEATVKDWTRNFTAEKETLESNPILARKSNDIISKLDRAFLMSKGLPMGRQQTKHAIISPSAFNIYGGDSFPGISDLLYGLDDLVGDERQQRIKELEIHVSDLMVVIKTATDYLGGF